MVKVALLVGVSEYEPGLNPLPGSVQDVDAMQRVLAHPELGGFAETDITVLKNPQRQAMEDAIYWLFSDRKKDDLLLFYFSGHGIKDESGRLYLATRTTRKDNNGRLVKPSAVAAAALHESINESRSQRQVMILDCCFSGAIAQGMTVKDDGTVNLKEYLGGKGRAILTSSTSTEYSFGSEAAGHGDAELSIYTRYLVEGIEKGAADTDGDGWIAVEELHEYAANRVKEAAPAMTPKFYPVEEGYKIVLARSPKDDPKLKYRKEVQVRAEQGQGQFSVIAQRLLAGKQIEWGISAEEAKAIEDEVLHPYREYALKQQEYEQALAEVVQTEYPLSATAEAELKEYQQHLGLRDSDIAAIEARILEPLKAKVAQQSAVHQQKLVQYEQALRDAIQHEFPFSQQTWQNLEELQYSLNLRTEDISSIKQSLIQQAELRYQEKLKREVEQQRQSQQESAEQERKQTELKQRLKKQHQERQQEYNEALRSYEQKFKELIADNYPIDLLAKRELMQLKVTLGLKEKDIEQIEQALILSKEEKYQKQKPLEENSSRKPEKVENYKQEPKTAKDARRAEKIENYKQEIKAAKDAKTCSNLGRTLINIEGEVDLSIAALRKAIQIDPSYWEAYNGLGQILRQNNRFEEAIIPLRKATQLNPDDSIAYFNLGIALVHTSQYEEAISAFHKVTSLFESGKSPGVPVSDAYHYLGVALQAQGKRDEAITAYRKAIDLETKHAISYSNLGWLLAEQGDLNEAVRVCQKAVSLKPNDAEVRITLGSVLLQQNKLEEGTLEFRKGIEIDPNNINNAAVHVTLGCLLKKKGKLNEAIVEYRRAIQLNPEHAQAHNQLGIALCEKNEVDEALVEFSKAIQIDPSYGAVYINLGDALKAKGRVAEANQAYQKAEQLGFKRKKFLGLF